MKRTTILPKCIIAQTILICAVTIANSAEQEQKKESKSYGTSKDNTGLISAPVYYENQMLIAATEKGVAAIIFEKPTELGVKYRFRYLGANDDPAKEVNGSGELFERYTDGKYDGGQLTIKAGEIELGWSRGGEKSGWIYYEPESQRLQIANAARFLAQLVRGNTILIQELDLRRFRLKK